MSQEIQCQLHDKKITTVQASTGELLCETCITDRYTCVPQEISSADSLYRDLFQTYQQQLKHLHKIKNNINNLAAKSEERTENSIHLVDQLLRNKLQQLVSSSNTSLGDVINNQSLPPTSPLRIPRLKKIEEAKAVLKAQIAADLKQHLHQHYNKTLFE